MKTFFLQTTLLLLLLLSAPGVSAQKDMKARSWKSIAHGKPGPWYGSAEALQLADTLIRYQTAVGGWPKNIKWNREIPHDEMRQIALTGIGATIDNGATTGEMRYLAKVYAQTHEPRVAESFVRALGYLLDAQYDNGGWPQFYPIRSPRSYSKCITYNDDAMLNVLVLLRDVRDGKGETAAIPLADSLRVRAGEAFDRGIDCIVKTQIRVDGEPTVWCAQHDENTLLPAKARAYELPSFSGAESAGLTLLLMELPDPSAEVIAAVKGARKWYDEHKIEGMKFVRERDAEGKAQAKLVPSEGDVIWARFYDLDTAEPFFCDRDGIKRKSIDELGHERRNGYGWYTTAPMKVLNEYEKWLERIGRNTK